MDYLQYKYGFPEGSSANYTGFKPYYKWITFNTLWKWLDMLLTLNSFKPYYKWITFNTMYVAEENGGLAGFKPYYKWITFNT